MIHFHDLADASGEQVHDWLEAIANHMRPADLDELRATNPLLTIGDPDRLLVLPMSIMNSEDAWVVVRYTHGSGEIARSYPMTADEATRMAADWVKDRT